MNNDAPTVELVCPHCGSGDLGSLERLYGGCRSTFFIQNGERVVEPHGYTDVYWDSTTSISIYCASCSYDFGDRPFDEALELLITPDQWEVKKEAGHV